MYEKVLDDVRKKYNVESEAYQQLKSKLSDRIGIVSRDEVTLSGELERVVPLREELIRIGGDLL